MIPPPEPKLLLCPFCKQALSLISTLAGVPFMGQCDNEQCPNWANIIDLRKYSPTPNAASDDTKLLDRLSQSTETEWQEFIRRGEKPETLEMQSKEHVMNKFNGVSEQGKNGLLWTVFEGEPFSGRRVASFSDQQEAWNYLEFRNNAASGEVDDVRINTIAKKYAGKHSVSCEYPEGCTCGTSADEKYYKQAILEATKDLMEDKKRLD